MPLSTIERERISHVLGAELHEPHPDWPDDFDNEGLAWYEGTPKYHTTSWDFEYRTVIRYVDPYSGVNTSVPKGYELVACYPSAGERECPCDGTDPGCPLCEGDGLIVTGEIAEVVFRAPPEDEDDD